jgi:DNA-binding transcriptional ArsR family regulator
VREPHHPSPDSLELPSVLHALSDPARLTIVRELGVVGECCCGEFHLAVSKATLSHHLRVLREAGLTTTRCDGRRRLISLRAVDLDERFPGLLEAVLAENGSKSRAASAA